LSSSEKVAIVTGAARPWGMGRCVARRLAEKGYDIAIVDVRRDWGEDAVREIRQLPGRDAAYFETDVSQRTSVEKMVRDVVEHFGRIDTLINNAAVIRRQRMEELTDDAIDFQMNINFRGTVLCSQAVLNVLRSQGSGGSIVNVASGGVVQPLKGLAIYTASKAAVIGFSRVLAVEAARDNIVVNVVNPGVMNTAMGSESGPEEEHYHQQGRHQLLQRPLDPQEVADVVVYAATCGSPALTGQVLHAVGGTYVQ
jgi:3-oxoacyl-[acyl-carrier protein] reductase